MPSPGLRERKKLETHRTIALAALRLIDEHGLEQVTVDDIAAEAGLSTRTFFNYFPSKEDAVLIAHADQAERTERTIARFGAQPAGLGTFAAMVQTMREEVAEVEENRDEWLARIRIIRAEPSLRLRATMIDSQAHEPMLKAIAERSGTRADQDLFPALAVGVLGSVIGAALNRWCALDGAKPLLEFFEEAAAIAAAGVPDPH